MVDVYRLYDAEGALLYVGKSVNVEKRVECHKYTAHWGLDIVAVKARSFPTQARAMAVEARAIRLLRPAHNVQHQRDWKDRIGRAKPPRKTRLDAAVKGLAAFWAGLTPKEVAEIEAWERPQQKEGD